MARLAKAVFGETWHVPDIGDNRTDPEPFRVLLEPMSGQEWQAWNAKYLGKITKRGGGNAAVVRATQRLREELIKNRVKQVEGYTVSKQDGSSFSPTNGEQLLEALQMVSANEAEIVVNDIALAIQDASTIQEKSGFPEA